MKLYYAPGACSLSPHIALREAGLDFELKKVDLKGRQIEGGGDYTQVNGKGYVPALQLDDGQVLTEGPVIVQYIADQKSDARLAPPAGSIERYRLQEWLNFITAEIHKQFSPLFKADTVPQWKQAAMDKLSERFGWLAKQLEGKSYLMGNQFSVADGYLFTVLSWSPRVGIDLAKWPALAQYQARVAERPHVREAMKAEGLTK